MPIEIVMPRLGWTMEEGSIVEWLHQEGAAIKVGDVLFTIESDKAINEFESFDAGILHIPLTAPAPGTKVPIGTLLAYLLQPGETPPTPSPASASPALATLPADHAAPVGVAGGATVSVPASVAVANPGALPTISPRARRIAAELGVAWTSLTGSGRSGRIVERDVRAAAERVAVVTPAARVSPLARRMATAAGVDPVALANARPGGRITSADLATVPVAPASPSPRIPLDGLRRLIAGRLSVSHQTTAPVTLTTEADATRLVQLRAEIKDDLGADSDLVPAYTDVIARLTALALLEHPALNASLEGEQIVRHTTVDIGIAVDTDDGVVVPVVRAVERKSLQQITIETRDLVAAVRARRAEVDALTGSTFTITNLGMYEIDAFTPIINLPECAILGLGRIVARPVVVDAASERIAVRQLMALSLTFDHRVVDGAPAARFLQRIKQFIERPTLWLMR